MNKLEIIGEIKHFVEEFGEAHIVANFIFRPGQLETVLADHEDTVAVVKVRRLHNTDLYSKMPYNFRSDGYH